MYVLIYGCELIKSPEKWKLISLALNSEINGHFGGRIFVEFWIWPFYLFVGLDLGVSFPFNGATV